jgi:hypothetical protein
VAAAHEFHDLHQLGRRVVLELHGAGEAGGKSRVGRDELAHLVRVASHDHHHVVPAVLHELDQGVDGLPAEVGAGARAAGGERVRLVDEQHAAARLLELLRRLERGRADILGHQIGSGHLHQLADAQHAERGQDPAV